MSLPISPVDLTGAVAGTTTGSMDWSSYGLPAVGGKPARILLYNESGCGLRCKLRGSGRGFELPAGGWFQDPLELQANETGLDFTVEDVLPNPPISKLKGTYIGAGEQFVSVSLGNSPIGLSGGGVPLSVSSVQNDGNSPGLTFVEATQVGAPSSDVKIDNGGNMTLAEWSVGAGAVTNIWQVSALVPAGNDVVKLGKAGNFWSHALGKFKVDGLSSLDNGNITTDGAGNQTNVGTVSSSGLVITGRNGFGGAVPAITWNNSGRVLEIWAPQSGAAAGYSFVGWNGSALVVPFSVGGQFSSALGWIDDNGNLIVHNTLAAASGSLFVVPQASGAASGIVLQAWSGSAVATVLGIGGSLGALSWFDIAGNLGGVAGVATTGRGVPVEGAQAFSVAISNTTLTTIATAVAPGSNAFVRVNLIFFIGASNANNGVITAEVAYTDPFTGTSPTVFINLEGAGALNGTILVKGAQYGGVSLLRQVSVGTAVIVKYSNTAAGTIADKVTAIVEWLG